MDRVDIKNFINKVRKDNQGIEDIINIYNTILEDEEKAKKKKLEEEAAKKREVIDKERNKFIKAFGDYLYVIAPEQAKNFDFDGLLDAMKKIEKAVEKNPSEARINFSFDSGSEKDKEKFEKLMRDIKTTYGWFE